MGARMKEELYKDIISILKSVSTNLDCEIGINDNLKELGVSSLSYVEMLVNLEDKYGIVFEDEMLDQENMANIESIADFVIANAK